VQYACVTATQEGARCRNFVENPGEMCEACQKLKAKGEEVKFAPSPDTILVKFNVNPNWAQKFEEAGIPRRFPSEVTLEEKHIAQAQQVNRDPYQLRNDIADSGSQVFGPKGVSEVSIFQLLEELREKGYQPQGVHIRTRREKKFDVLVIPFLCGIPDENSTSLPEKALERLREFLKLSCWGFVHIWANPPEKGKIVHTVNLSHREPQKSPQWNLCFNHGLWAIETS